MKKMLLLIHAGYNHVVLVAEDKSKVPSDAVHDPLERHGGVPEAEWHPQELVEAKWSYDGRLRNVVLLHGNLVIPFLRSSLLNTLHPFSLEEKSSILGKGYLSASVTMLCLL